MTVNQAKEVLRNAGYFVDNLWHVDDVKSRFECEDNEIAQNILYNALTNEHTMDQIWFALHMVAEDNGLEFKEEEDDK